MRSGIRSYESVEVQLSRSGTFTIHEQSKQLQRVGRLSDRLRTQAVGVTEMKKPTFLRIFFFVFISSVMFGSTLKPCFAQRAGGGFHGGTGFRGGSMSGGLRAGGGIRTGALPPMRGGPSWHSRGPEFAWRGPVLSRRSSFGLRNRAVTTRPTPRFERQARNANRPPNARFEPEFQDANRPPTRFERQVQDSNRPPSARFESQGEERDSGRTREPLASPHATGHMKSLSVSPRSEDASAVARNSRNAETPSQLFSGSLSKGSHSAISARRAPAKPAGTHFGTTQPRASASPFADAKSGTPFAGGRFANPFDNRLGSMMSGRNGLAGTGFNRFDPNMRHVFNNTFGFNEFGFDRFAFHNFFFDRFFFDRFFFFNRFGFFPFFFPGHNFFFFDFALFPSFGFLGQPWWWQPSLAWWDPTSQWDWSSSPPPAWGSSVRNSNPDLSGGTSNASAESRAMDENESEGSPRVNPTIGNAVFLPSVLLYLKDGTVYGASDYWFAGNKLHFIVTDGVESAVAMDELDLQRTVDETAKRGVSFTLKLNPNDSNTTPNKPE